MLVSGGSSNSISTSYAQYPTLPGPYSKSNVSPDTWLAVDQVPQIIGHIISHLNASQPLPPNAALKHLAEGQDTNR